MPILKRLVDTPMTHEEVKAHLMEYLSDTPPVGVALVNDDGSPGEPIMDDDYLIPNIETYKGVPIVPGTYVLVVQTIPRAGVFLAVFATTDGQRGYSLMRGNQFSGKYAPRQDPKKVKSNPRR